MSPEKIPTDPTEKESTDTVLTVTASAETVSDNPAADNESSEKNARESIESKLLAFDEDNKVTPGKDINTKITALDTDLEHLRAELSTINNSVEEGLDRLSDTDTDLTAKVSETYKRLGEIDNAYKSLLEISSRIDTDIQKLNGDVSTVAEQSAVGIKHLEQSTIAQSTAFTQKNQQVVSRVNQLVETSKLTGELLGEKIQSTTERILQAEQKLIAEIDGLSAVTDEKTKALQGSVESNRARILKLQSVDEAIIKRATMLEITSAELSVKGQEMMGAIDRLEQDTRGLSGELIELQDRTEQLEAKTNSHGSLIRSLQQASSNITHNIAVLSRRENKRFNLFIGSFIVLLIAVAAIVFIQSESFDAVAAQFAERNSNVDAQFDSLQQAQLQLAQESSNSALATNESLLSLENKVAVLNDTLKEEVNKELALTNSKMQQMQDQVQSVEGRFNNSSSFSNIGNDNIIHGEHWIKQQVSSNYSVQVAYTDSRDAMFDIAQSNNRYLDDALFSFKVEKDGISKYAMLMGSYPSRQQAMEKVDSLPTYINMQRPTLRKIADVQKFIEQQ